MVLSSEEETVEARLLGDVDPLRGVEMGRVEDAWIDFPGAPFRVGEGVGPEVDEESQGRELPLELGGRGNG